MSITIELSPEEERRYQDLQARGVDIQSKVRELLSNLSVPSTDAAAPRELRTSTARLIQSWIDEGDEDEQRETFEAIKEGLNANHSSYRKIFP